MIFLSIIIPHYNTPKTLQKLLDSIPDTPEIEVFVIDDMSNQYIKEYEVCKQIYCKRNIKFLNNYQKGAGNARNVGLENSDGEWILFADADDFFVNNFVEIIKKYTDTDADIVYFAPTSIMLESEEPSERHVHYMELVKKYCTLPNHENEINIRYKYWSPCSKLIRRELIAKKNICFDGTLHSNDMMFSTKVGHYADKVIAVDEIIYCITQSKNSLTTKKDKKSIYIRKKVFCNYYLFLYKKLSRCDLAILGFGFKDFMYFSLWNTWSSIHDAVQKEGKIVKNK